MRGSYFSALSICLLTTSMSFGFGDSLVKGSAGRFPEPRTETGAGSETQVPKKTDPQIHSSEPNSSDQTQKTGSPSQAASFLIPVKVRGLSGTLVLQNNSGDDLAINVSGDFEFSKKINWGGSYSVSIKTQPQEQTCALYQNSGSQVSSTPVSVVVHCSEFWSPPQHAASNRSIASNNVNGVFAAGSTVYAATDVGLSISNDGGATWSNKTTAQGLGSNDVRGVYASGRTIYAATTGGLSISTDGGATWSNKTTAHGLWSDDVRGVYAAGSSIYAATDAGLSVKNPIIPIQ